MSKIKSICVNCGSSAGKGEIYLLAARALGIEVAKRGITLVYGGANIGLMGELANSALQAGGRVVGIIPTFIYEKVGHNGLTELEIVESMHVRKARMHELSDGFIALPGGFGTFEEMFEVLTWTQLGFHEKPCGLLNVNGYYDELLKFLDHSVEERFIREEHKRNALVSINPGELIDMLSAFEAPRVDKWLDRDKVMGSN